jgi:hypothetical protein
VIRGEEKEVEKEKKVEEERERKKSRKQGFACIHSWYSLPNMALFN